LPVLRVPVDELAAGEIVLDPEASRYVARVRRVGEGERILLFDPKSSREATALVLGVDRAGVRCRVGAPRASTAVPHRKTTLLQGLGKGDKMDAIVRDATELGATRVVAVETARSVTKLGARGDARRERWQRVAVEAARQCGRGDTPDVIGPLDWTSALASFADDPTGADVRLCLWEGATHPIGAELPGLSSERPLVIAVGPEGGFDAAEIDLARSRGFTIVSLGPFILRTETVASAVLGAALVLSRDTTFG
jgi:16S rRNA (uracil1498-N3)-methyltransferase